MNLETNMVSDERCFQYADRPPAEAPGTLCQAHTPPATALRRACVYGASSSATLALF